VLGEAATDDSERTPRVRVAANSTTCPVKTPAAALHPGSGSERKNWPIERYRELAHLLERKGLRTVWVLGPAEDEGCAPAGSTVWHSPSLVDLAAFLARCELYVGNDSGVTHLAAASGCPTVALFGPSNPAVWGPRGESGRIVFSAVRCSPCHPSRDTDVSCDRACMRGISVDRVITECIALLAAGAGGEGRSR
jgi:ADP-heptose:LPS heptosyltransferase